MDVATISRLERGESIPSLTRLETLAGKLGVELIELFRFKGKPSVKDEAIDRLVTVISRRGAADIDAVTAVVEVMLRGFGR